MAKKVRQRLAPILVRDHDDVEAARTRAYDGQIDELLGFVEALRFALKQGSANWPVKAEFPDPPDVVMSWPQERIAVEASRIGWTRQSAVLAAATNRYLDAAVEMSPHLCDQGLPTGRLSDRTGSYGAIKKPTEQFNSPGFAGDDAELLTLKALQAAIDRKNSMIDRYREKAQTDRVWLFLLDYSIPGAIQKILRRVDLRAKAKATCAASLFERVLLCHSSGTTELMSL